jgi:hypothetical protein
VLPLLKFQPSYKPERDFNRAVDVIITIIIHEDYSLLKRRFVRPTCPKNYVGGSESSW